MGTSRRSDTPGLSLKTSLQTASNINRCLRRPDVPAGALRAATGAMDRENRGGLREIRRGLATRDQSGWPRRSLLGTSRLGTSRLLGPFRIAQVWRRLVQSVSDALALCAGLTRFGRHGEAAWCGEEDTGGTRTAFRAGGRQLAFRHRPHLCERPALLAHIFVRRHRPPAFGQNASCGGPVRRDCGKPYQLTAGL